MKIEMQEETFTIEMKRFYLPLVIEAKCPECGELVERDCADDYLSYVEVFADTAIHMVHDIDTPNGGYDEHEFEVMVRFGFTAQAVQPS